MRAIAGDIPIGRNVFTTRTVRHWNRLLKEAVDCTTLDSFKTQLGGVLGDPHFNNIII